MPTYQLDKKEGMHISTHHVTAIKQNKAQKVTEFNTMGVVKIKLLSQLQSSKLQLEGRAQVEVTCDALK